MKVIQTNFNYRSKLIPLDPNKMEYIFIHHPAWSIATPEMIHLDVLNDPAKVSWAGFPYNEYIRKDGTVYVGRGDHIGAQVGGFNSKSYGISCEGNYDVEKVMPDAQFKSLVTRVLYHMYRFPKTLTVLPHHAMQAGNSCPGRFFPLLEMYKSLEEERLKSIHWAEKHRDDLIKKGYVIHDKRFDDNITRGEVFALLNQK
jgi:N-acetylmuramoyl-L-alanine amidase